LEKICFRVSSIFFFDLFKFLVETDAEGMVFWLFLQGVQLVLQFDDRFLKIELVFHRCESLGASRTSGNAEFRMVNSVGILTKS